MQTLLPISTSVPVTASTKSTLPTAEPYPKGANMTTNEICEWLKTIQLPDEFIKCFKDHDIDGDTLADLTDDDLKELGVSVGYERKKIIKKFSKIKN